MKETIICSFVGLVLFLVGLVIGRITKKTKITVEKCESKNKVADIVEMLGRVVPVNDDIYESLGILVSDIDDILSTTTETENEKQKKDAIQTLKFIEDKIKKM